MKMTVYIFITVLCGILISYFLFPTSYTNQVDTLINITLTVTIFFIGIGIGQNKHIFKDLKKVGLKILILPIGTIVGSLIGGLITGLLIQQSLTLSLAIASGFGWYSISAGLLLPSGADIATIGFIANVVREMLTFILVPLLAKKLSPYTLISVGGATTMDTTLPLISRALGKEYAVISFIHGAILSLLVSILVQFFASI